MKSFKDLIADVHNKGICQQCGGCVSFCNSIEHHVIGFKHPNNPPTYLNKDKCLKCGICYLICPQTHSLEEEVNETFQFSNFNDTPLGFYYNIYSCQANDAEFLACGTDGGVVNSLLYYLLKKDLIDGAIVAKNVSPFVREVIIAETKDDLIMASGIKLDLTPQLDELQRFHTYTQSLPKLKQYQDKRLAVVGTPCQIYTIRCMQELGIMPSGNIEYCFGLFCYENFFFDSSQTKKFEELLGVPFNEIKKINIKEHLIVTLEDGTKKSLNFAQLEAFMRSACNACSDFTNLYADLSFGGLASPEKFTTVLARTQKGRDLMLKSIKAEVLSCRKLSGQEKQDMVKTLMRYSESKIQRKNDFFKKKEN